MTDKEYKISDIDFYFDIIEESKAVFEDRNGLSEMFKKLKKGRYFGSIRRVRNIRSKEQNNAMWGIPYMYIKQALIETGNFENPSNEQVHKTCMNYCLPEDYKERIYKEWKESEGVVNFLTSEIIKDPFRLTTTKMSIVDAMNYYSNLQKFYAENLSSGREGDFIPDPDKDYKNKNKKDVD